jgi:6-phosphogluconolactonase
VTVIVAAPGEFVHTAASWIASTVKTTVQAQGSCSLALAGGSTPRAIYQQLAQLDVPWPAVQIYFGDERRVPPDHVDSNYRMVRESLLDALVASPPLVHRMQALEDGEEAARAYERVLPERLDVLLLGMGGDAHTASLFPGSAATQERMRRILHVPGPPGSVDRLTVTPAVIESAREVAVLVAGRAKARIVREALHSTVDPFLRPVQLAKRGTWILDDEAAAELPPLT